MFNIRLKNRVKNWHDLRAGKHPTTNTAVTLLRTRFKTVATVATFAYHLLAISLLMLGQTQHARASDNILMPFCG